MRFSRPVSAFATVCAVALLGLTACSNGNTTAVAENCQPRWEFKTIESGTLTIAAVQQMPAADINPNTGDLSGLDPVLLEEFAKQACLKTDWKAMSGAAATAALTEGVADVGAGGFFKSEKRGKVMGQTSPTWLDALSVLSKDRVSSPEDLIGKKVGLVGGAVFEESLVALIGKDNVAPYQSLDGSLEDLIAGRIDAVYNSGGVLTYQKRERGLEDFSLTLFEVDSKYPVLSAPGEPNLPFTKSNTALGDALNEFLSEAHSDGTVVETLAKYGIEDAKVPESGK